MTKELNSFIQFLNTCIANLHFELFFWKGGHEIILHKLLIAANVQVAVQQWNVLREVLRIHYIE